MSDPGPVRQPAKCYSAVFTRWAILAALRRCTSAVSPPEAPMLPARAPTIAIPLPGLLADQGAKQDGYQPGANFQVNMRRRHAALRSSGPVVYQEEERSF